MNAFVNLKAVGGLDTLGVVLGYHDYEAERISADYGSEVNVSVAAKLKKVNFMLKYADYQRGRAGRGARHREVLDADRICLVTSQLRGDD